MGKSNNQRQKEHQARLREQGLVPVVLWVRPEQAGSLKEMAEVMRAHPHLEAGTLRDPNSGKLVGLQASLRRLQAARAGDLAAAEAARIAELKAGAAVARGEVAS